MDKYTISKEYLDEVLIAWSQSLVGKCMKRFELSEDKEEIKKAVKELIYESARDFKSIVRAFSTGVQFITPKTEKKV